MSKIVYSTKFKRDYVTVFAVILFIFIVIGEVFIAISVPMYMEQENVLALESEKLKMQESFDYSRYLANSVNPNGDIAKSELALIKWNLDLMARYLRTEANYMTSEEISLANGVIKDMTLLLTKLNNGNSICKEEKLDVSFYLNSLFDKGNK